MAKVVGYYHLTYEDYKGLQKQMEAFKETIHVSTPGPFYHKSIRLRIAKGHIIEFHGPNVRGKKNGRKKGRKRKRK